jgi:hypothetical protein
VLWHELIAKYNKSKVIVKYVGRPRNRWHDEVREDRRIVGGEEWQGGMEEAPENGKESSHSAHAN